VGDDRFGHSRGLGNQLPRNLALLRFLTVATYLAFPEARAPETFSLKVRSLRITMDGPKDKLRNP